MRAVTHEGLERVCRLYHTNSDAAVALGVARGSLARACRRHGIETPYARRRRQIREAKEG